MQVAMQVAITVVAMLEGIMAEGITAEVMLVEETKALEVVIAEGAVEGEIKVVETMTLVWGGVT